MNKLKIVYMGTPEFAVAPLESLLASGHSVEAVVTVPDKCSGRGLKVNESAVKKYAVEKGLPVLQPEKLRSEEFIQQLKDINADLFVVVAFRMLPEIVWAMPRLGTFNLHASLLPQYRGAAPINWAIINGETETGVTTFLLDKEIDTGSILFQEKCSIAPEDNLEAVHDRLQAIGSRLVVETVNALAEGKTDPQPQDISQPLKPAPKLTKETCRINWNESSVNIINLIRGLSPYPCAYSNVKSNADGKETSLKIFQARIADKTDNAAAPGTIVSDGKSQLLVKTADGFIELESMQLAGKKRLSTKEFLMGFRNPEDHVLV